MSTTEPEKHQKIFPIGTKHTTKTSQQIIEIHKRKFICKTEQIVESSVFYITKAKMFAI